MSEEYAEFPECKKFSGLAQTMAIEREFLEWLSEQGYHLAKYNDEDELFPCYESEWKLLYRYHEIDEQKLEKERRELIQQMRDGRAGGN